MYPDLGQLPFSIDAAEADHAGVLTEISHRSKKHWGYPDSYMRLWRDALTITPAFIDANTVFFAHRDSSLLGFGALAESRTVFELEALFVDPPYIGQGIGKSLLQHALGMVEAGHGRCLKVISDPNAEAFYCKYGGRRVGTAPSEPPGRRLPVLLFDL